MRLARLGPVSFVLGLASLSFVVGAAVMFFEVPPSGFLHKAFVGVHTWHAREQAARPGSVAGPPVRSVPRADKPDKTFDGFTLCSAAPGAVVSLINMRGDVVHHWDVPFNNIWPDPPHVSGPMNEGAISCFDCRVYPNGDLLVVFDGVGRIVNGFGLVKVDKSSNVLWKYSANAHHDVEVGEDGTIYAITQKLVKEAVHGLDFLPVPYVTDSLVLLSADGNEFKSFPILEALQSSPYSPLLSCLERPQGTRIALGAADDEKRRDVLHTNHAMPLSRKLAPRFPQFKPGQVLLSLRNLDTLAVLDPATGAVAWAARGPWKGQHDAQFLDNGHLLIYDNLGSPLGTRVLEYDPKTQAFPWTYRGDFVSADRGMAQRLPNGNTLVVDTDGSQMLEVTPDKELVWSCLVNGYLQVARRYAASQLHFLKKGERARP